MATNTGTSMSGLSPAMANIQGVQNTMMNLWNPLMPSNPAFQQFNNQAMQNMNAAPTAQPAPQQVAQAPAPVTSSYGQFQPAGATQGAMVGPMQQQLAGPPDPWVSKWGAQVAPAVHAVAKQLGLSSTPLDYNAQGQAVDQNGNIVQGAPTYAQYKQMVDDMVAGRSVVASQPNGQPQIGLSGSENALQGGMQGALGILDASYNQGRQDINNSTQAAIGQLTGPSYSSQDANDLALDAYNIGKSNLAPAQAIGTAALYGAQGQGLDATRGAINSGVGALSGFAGAGQAAQYMQAALSGALGPQAQAQAYQQYSASPGQAYLQEQGEQAITRNAAATGGLQGGNVLKELQRQGVGLAAQDFGANFERLGSLSQQGLQASGQIGQLRGAQAGLESGLIGQTGQGVSNLNQNLAQTGAGLAGQLGSSVLGLQGQLAGQQANTNQAAANIYAGAGQNLANYGMQAGAQAANIAYGTGQQLSQGRTGAGELIAANIGGTSTALANLQNQQGAGLSEILGATGGNLSQLLQQSGITEAQLMQSLSALLANSGQGASSTLAGLPGVPGTQQNPGILQDIGAAAGGVGTALAVL
jgi:hypothetical protein